MYLLDSNILIAAKNGYYSFNICPGFWKWIKNQSNNGAVGSIEMVKQEINDGDNEDALKLWINSGTPLRFYSPDQATIEAMQKLTDWVLNQQYKQHHIDSFLAKADPLIIAYAMAHGHKVVTHEAVAAQNSTKVKIPNVCIAMDVDYLNTFEMLQQENAIFDLEVH